ncbi:MAG: hypothetical protein ACWGSQ_12535 [Longimicrobiales bacterium]
MRAITGSRSLVGSALFTTAMGWAWATAAAGQETGRIAPLPADPPIGGVLWTVIIPSALLIGSFLATYLLYRRFSKEEG